MTTPETIEAMRRYRRLLEAREAATMQELARRWVRLERALADQLELLATDIAARQAAGQAVSADLVRLSKRYLSLQQQVLAELSQYAGFAAETIAAEQRWMMAAGVQHGSELLRAALSVRGGFDVLPTAALEHMAGYVADGSPLRQYFARMYPSAMQGIMDALFEGLARGQGPRQIAKRMRDEMGVAARTAINSARTEPLRVYREASLAQYRKSGLVDGYIRVASKSVRTCMACLAQDGEWFPLDVPFAEHNMGRCVAPGTVVSGPPVKAFIARDYDGEVVSIRTASGKFLTVTPNHPVLTDRGWRAAHLIQEGDNVVGCSGEEWRAPAVYPDEYQVPTLIEEVAGALAMRRARVVPVAAEDFHGDGLYSQVYVVWTDGLLSDGREAAVDQQPLHAAVIGGMMHAASLPGASDVALMLKGMPAAARSLLSDGDAAMVLFEGGLLGEQAVGLGLAADGHALQFQADANGLARDAVGFGQGVLGYARHVAAGDLLLRQLNAAGAIGSGGMFGVQPAALSSAAEEASLFEDVGQPAFVDVMAAARGLDAIAVDVILDRVLEVGVSSFRGHVYNLHTDGEWYLANGVVTHNCRPIPAREGTKFAGTQGLDWFRSQPPATQKLMLGPGRFEAWQAGKFDLKDLATLHEDPVWGNSWQETPLKRLVGTGSPAEGTASL